MEHSNKGIPNGTSFDAWNSIVNGYTTPTTPPTNPNGKNIYESNDKEMNVILYGLTGFEFVKVMHCESTKHI